MTLNLAIDTGFMITAHPLHKGTLQMKHEPDLVKERKDIPQTSDLGRSDGYQNKSTKNTAH